MSRETACAAIDAAIQAACAKAVGQLQALGLGVAGGVVLNIGRVREGFLQYA